MAFNATGVYRGRPKPQPNLQTLTAQNYTNEFLEEPTQETNSRILNLIQRNFLLGGSPFGYSYMGTIYSADPAAHEPANFIPEIHSSLAREAEGLYLRTGNLQSVRIKLEQALVSILARCNMDISTFRDALPDSFVERITLQIYPRQKAYGFMLKSQPMLAAPYRVIDEAVLYINRYRLLD